MLPQANAPRLTSSAWSAVETLDSELGRTANTREEYEQQRAAQEHGVIYRITAPSGKSYIGQTRRFRRRMMEHAKAEHQQSKKHACHLLERAIRKYGWAQMQVELLANGLSKAELDIKERELIALHKTLKPGGYNLAPGGNVDLWQVPELAASRRAAMKEPEYRERMRAAAAKPGTRERKLQGFQRWLDDGGIETMRKTAENARKTCKSPAALAKMRNTFTAKREEVLAKLSPKEAARRRRKAEKDSLRHARLRAEARAKLTDGGEGLAGGGEGGVVDARDARAYQSG